MSKTEENARPSTVEDSEDIEDLEAEEAQIAAAALALGWYDPSRSVHVAQGVYAKLYNPPPGFPSRDRPCEELQRMHRYLLKLGRYYDDRDDKLAESIAPILLAAAQAAELLVSEELREALIGITAASCCPFGSPEYEQYFQFLQRCHEKATAALQVERHRFRWRRHASAE